MTAVAKVSPAGTILLLLEAAVADLAKTVEEHRSGKRISRFTLVQAGVNSSTQLNDLQRRQTILTTQEQLAEHW
jgi:hypothetical protein